MPAALKQAVTPAQPRRQVTYVVAELVKRLKEATDWLVSPTSSNTKQFGNDLTAACMLGSLQIKSPG